MTLQEFIKQESEMVIQQVCQTYLVSRSDLLGRSKITHHVIARRAAMQHLLDRGFSYFQIAKAIERNRSTVYYWSGARFRERQRRKMREYSSRAMEARI